jgi:hypothetical protein
MAANTAAAGAMRRVRLEQLQQLSDEGKRAELASTIAGFSTKELRTLCGGFGVPAQSKEYAAYQSKAGYAELLAKLLEARTASAVGILELVSVTGTGTPTGRTRKTKNCNLRLVNVLFSDTMAQYMNELVGEVARKKRNIDGVSPFWERVRAEFVSNKAEYGRIAFPEDQAFVDFNLASPIAHSSEKLRKMWEKLGLAYASVFSQFGLAGGNEVHVSTCAGRQDVYYLQRWLNEKPQLLAIVCKSQRDTDAVGQPATEQSVQALRQGTQSPQQSGQQSLQPVVQQNGESQVPPPIIEPAACADRPNKDNEGEELMKSIKLAYDVLAVMSASDRGSEIEHTVRRRLHRCAKRLKTIEDENDTRSRSL